MGINMGSRGGSVPAGGGSIVPAKSNEFEVKEFDIKEERRTLTDKYIGSDEVDRIVSTIYVDDPNTIVSFGNNVAENIANASDVILRSMDMDKVNDSGEMLALLSKIMDKFDIDEIQENKGLFNKLFGNLKKQLDKILDKYHTMGEEVDKVYVQLKAYESEINQSNKKLEDLFQANVGYYEELVKYILAGEQGINELNEYIEQRRNELSQTQDNSIQFELTSLEQAQQLLEQRVHDLRISENVALQSIPMIKTMQFSNLNLIRKINSAFIITLPVFKQALAQAVLLKRQKIQAEAMSALDKRTNEMLIKNAQNTVAQSKLTTQLASGNSIKMETLETTWRTIMSGIEETKRIQEDAKKRRADEVKRLEAIKDEFDKAFINKPVNQG